MTNFPDDPRIVDAEQNGIDGYDGLEPSCPVCGSKRCDQVYLNRDGEVVGCEYCVKRMCVWEWSEANAV